MASHTHTAGIIPIANLPTDINSPVPEILLPVSNGLTAIQKSVFECAMAGCSTIWIVANNDLAPIVRKTIGDWTYDPVYYERKFYKFYADHRKEVPIYYVPIHPKDRDRRDSYGWSALYGVYTAWYTAYKISKWILPNNYFISFPMSMYDIYDIRKYRKQIANPKANFFLTYKGQSVRENICTPFTMKGEDFKKCRKSINQKTTREFLPPLLGQKYPSQKLPISQRWSARQFSIQDVFAEVDDTQANRVELDWYYDISEWDQYRLYMGSEKVIETPRKELTLPHTHANIPYST
jgi:hypothetical protein